jgi:APA family basic amino acid/polyamine antiporter
MKNVPGDREESQAGEAGLRRVVSVRDAAALAIGIVVGTGIFAVPGFIADQLRSPGPILLLWLLGGGLSLAGAMTYAELAGLFPRQGGSFIYVLRAFGPYPAFLMGWGPFLVGFPASAAAIATVFGTYVAAALGGDGRLDRPLALAALVAVWGLNLRGTRFSVSLQTALTLLKVGALGILGVLALAVAPGDWSRLFAGSGAPWPGVGAFATALVGVYWTFDGWGNLTVIGGEIENPRREIARALLATIGVVTAVYLLLNVAYLVLLPMEELRSTDSVASTAAGAVLGRAGSTVVAVLVAVSAFGALFGISVSGPRYFFAMGRSGLFFEAAGRVDSETAAPRWGSTALFVTSVVYVATGSFTQIMSYYVALTALYGVLSPAALFRFRRTLPDAPRAFRVPGYPFTPALFMVAALGVTIHQVLREPVRSGVGLVLLLASVPAYLVWRRARRDA